MKQNNKVWIIVGAVLAVLFLFNQGSKLVQVCTSNEHEFFSDYTPGEVEALSEYPCTSTSLKWECVEPYPYIIEPSPVSDYTFKYQRYLQLFTREYLGGCAQYINDFPGEVQPVTTYNGVQIYSYYREATYTKGYAVCSASDKFVVMSYTYLRGYRTDEKDAIVEYIHPREDAYNLAQIQQYIDSYYTCEEPTTTTQQTTTTVATTTTLDCNTFADENCDQIVDRSELGNTISDWLIDIIDRIQLGEAIAAWMSG